MARVLRSGDGRRRLRMSRKSSRFSRPLARALACSVAIPLTASNTADCTIAVTRADAGGGVFAISSASTAVRFQSVTTSALAAPGAASERRKSHPIG
jgi:ribonuclease PH